MKQRTIRFEFWIEEWRIEVNEGTNLRYKNTLSLPSVLAKRLRNIDKGSILL